MNRPLNITIVATITYYGLSSVTCLVVFKLGHHVSCRWARSSDEIEFNLSSIDQVD